MSSELSNIVLTDSIIKYKGEGGSLVGAHATIESAGDVERRITAIRLVLTGPLALAWRKNKDHRELYLTVEGPGYAFTVPIDPKAGQSARELASRINALASRAAQTASSASPAAAPTAPVGPPPGWYIAPSDPPGILRWWDGFAWGEQTQPAPVS
jgi:hypothetical protein